MSAAALLNDVQLCRTANRLGYDSTKDEDE